MKRQCQYTETEYNTQACESKKIVLLGDGCIGKSTFFDKLNKLNDSEYTFQKKYKATDNFDFNRIKIDTNVHFCVHRSELTSGLRHIQFNICSLYKRLSFIYGYKTYIYIYMFLNVLRLARSVFLSFFS